MPPFISCSVYCQGQHSVSCCPQLQFAHPFAGHHEVQADLLAASEKKLTELEGLVARGEVKAAAKEFRGFARSLKGTPLEARAQALADKIKPPKT